MKIARLIALMAASVSLAGCSGFGIVLGKVIDRTIKDPIMLVASPFQPGKAHPPKEPLEISGVVVDENGNDVSGSRFIVWSNYSRIIADKRMDAARFAETMDDQAQMIDVTHEGYYPRHFAIYSGKLVLYEEAGYEVNTRTETPAHAARIVLRKHGTLTELERRLETLHVTAKGDGVIVAPSMPAAMWESARWIAGVENAPANYLYLTTSRTGAGIPAVAFGCGECRYLKPQEVRIGIAGEGNGLQLYSPKVDEDVWYEMRQAPESGYQSEIKLDESAIARLADNKRLCFYFKCGNRYGRLMYSDWDEEVSNGDVLLSYGARIIIYLQPDGSPNLEQDPKTPAFTLE